MCFFLVSAKRVSRRGTLLSSSPCPGARHSRACGRRPENLADLSKVTVLVGSRLEQKVRTWKPLPRLVSRKHTCNVLGLSYNTAPFLSRASDAGC